MADSSPLLDRAAQIQGLVEELANGIREIDRSTGDETQRQVALAWKALLPAIIEAGESLPSEPNPLADWIREVGRVSNWFNGVVRQHGLAGVLFRFNCDGLIRVADEGRALFKELAAKRDPFAFVDEPAASNPSGIDTTPALPKAPNQCVKAAARDVPSILANVSPGHDRAIELIASHLAKRLQDAGHTLAAAQWAVHELVRAGRLQPGLIEVENPSFGRVVGGTMRRWGGRDDRRMEWSGGGKRTVGIPKGKPAPFENFKVTATESLWTWWRLSAVETPTQGEPAAPAIKAGEANVIERLRDGLDHAELSPRKLARLDAHPKQPVSLAQLPREVKAEGKSETVQRMNKLKLKPDFNRNLQAANAASKESEPTEPELMQVKAEAMGGEPVELVGDGGLDSPTGFLGGAALANALGIHATRRSAFFRQLERQRMSLEDDCWHEVRDPRPNSPRFLYRADLPKLRNLAAAYKNPKPA